MNEGESATQCQEVPRPLDQVYDLIVNPEMQPWPLWDEVGNADTDRQRVGYQLTEAHHGKYNDDWAEAFCTLHALERLSTEVISYESGLEQTYIGGATDRLAMLVAYQQQLALHADCIDYLKRCNKELEQEQLLMTKQIELLTRKLVLLRQEQMGDTALC